MKACLTVNVLRACPDHKIPFQVCTDSSDHQLREVTIQNGKVVAHWSKKLTAEQARCLTMEKEPLAIILCFEEFKNVLPGAIITVFTDHKNLTFKTLNTTRVLRWCLFLEERDAKFQHFPGKDDVLADCLLRLPCMEKPSMGKETKVEKRGKAADFLKSVLPNNEDGIDLENHQALLLTQVEQLIAEQRKGFASCREETDRATTSDIDEIVLTVVSV